jgi:hypothetical protein
MPTPRIILGALAWALCAALAAGSAPAATTGGQKSAGTGANRTRDIVRADTAWITADHSRHEELKQDFESGPEVTEACLSCHNKAAAQFHETIHWTWTCPADPEGVMGKNGLTMNNF